jgi:hypothetical protein
MSFEQLHASILDSMGVTHNRRKVCPQKFCVILVDWVSSIIKDGTVFNKNVLSDTDVEFLKPIVLDYTSALIKKILKTILISNEILQLVACGSLIVSVQHILGYDWMSQDESELHKYLSYQCMFLYTSEQIDKMGTCIHRMFNFLPHVTLETNTNQCYIDNLFIKNIKPDTNSLELESMQKQALKLAKQDTIRVNRLILLSKTSIQSKKSKSKLIKRQR